jgi:hypothetical protein
MSTFSQRSIIDSANVDSAHICARQAAYATGCEGASYTTIFFARACCERDIVASRGGKQRGAVKLQSRPQLGPRLATPAPARFRFRTPRLPRRPLTSPSPSAVACRMRDANVLSIKRCMPRMVRSISVAFTRPTRTNADPEGNRAGTR